MSGRRNESLYYTNESPYPRTRRPPPAHPAPNNVGVVLLLVMLLAIVIALALVGPGLVSQVRHMVYCMQHAQESVCT